VLFGWHVAYFSDISGLKVGRAVVVAEDHVAVVEFASPVAAPIDQWSLTVPLHPGASRQLLFGLADAQALTGCEQPLAGWFSRTYGQWEPAPWLVTDHAPKVWGTGAQPPWSAEGAVTIDGLVLEAVWTASAVNLRVSDLETGRRHEMRAE
jgi:hypothetical protein